MRSCAARWVAPVIVAAAAAGALGEPASIYPRGPEPAPVACDHFPSRLHAFLWRNWGLVPDERIARVLGASVEDVSRVAASMGLPERTSPSGEMLRRGYITLIRRNWHLLPYEQLLLLLDWSPERLVFTLREDDFLWTKLGSLKPRCEPLVFREPSADETAWAARTRDLVTSLFGERWFERGEPRFRFIAELSEPLPRRAAVRSSASSGASSSAPAGGASRAALSPRFLYSYFALYGDPLLEPELDPFPDGYLE
ncbi:MAG: hypothetical protein JXA90_00750, partial [Planctomycetes bacterium]|nr:hypothetical protein [Planctomycetota bacterium]